MLTQRLKILTALVISFILVEGYAYFSQNPTVVPIQAENIKNLLANIKFSPASLTRLFTLKLSNDNSLAQINPSEITPMAGVNNGLPPVYLTPTPIQPTKKIGSGNPTPTIKLCTGQACLSPTEEPPDDELVDFPFEPGDVDNLPGGNPTNAPKPTKIPKPTKVPPPPPITSDIRPGNSLKEIFQEVNKRACFPMALMKAIQYMESGSYFKESDPSSKIKIYNTYGWWKTGAGNPCTGLGYHTQTGIVPDDSIYAGTSCSSAIGSPIDIKIMGLMQISEWEQEFVQKHISSQLPKNDRRVFFDNALMFAFISRSRVGDPPKDCNDWPDDVVKLVAEKHSGTCEYYYSINGVSGNYCKEILDLYKQYQKEK